MSPADLDQIVVDVTRALPHVLAAWIFGSRADGTARPGSDLDIAVMPMPGQKPPAGIEERIAAAVAARTGLDVDVCQLTDASPVLGIEAVGHGRRVFVRDEALADAAEERVRRRYLDTAHLRRVQNHYLYGDNVTLRPRSLEGRLRRLQTVVRRLRRYRDLGADGIVGNEDLEWAVERGLHLGCEIVLDVGNHILASAFSRTTETYEQILDALHAEAVISAELRAELAGLGGFRNVLVHDYLDLDMDRVLAALDAAPDRLARFAAEVHAWLSRQPS
jgi:uncharacterized protein YutE (UPF0331/DUF86 family)/predicted nucleotidyltransferase